MSKYFGKVLKTISKHSRIEFGFPGKFKIKVELFSLYIIPAV